MTFSIITLHNDILHNDTQHNDIETRNFMKNVENL
jgi:hypothetical protein